MKFRDFMDESSLSSSYSKISSKIKNDAKKVSSILKYDEDDMYENPKEAEQFWLNFYEEMDMLKDVLNGYFQLLGEIPSNDEIFNDHELGKLETKIRELSMLISKNKDNKYQIKIQ
nr:MAG TPA: hypothetical protein [Caudoviricetes sp.]